MSCCNKPVEEGRLRMPESRGLRKSGGRFVVYAMLVALAPFYLTPLAVVFLNSFRSLEEITQTSVLGVPQTFHWENWGQGWGSYCIGGICSGISPYIWNSVAIAVPATILSTLVGALNGYLLSLWRFKGAQIAFGVITFGVFLPAQMKLVPWAITLRALDLSDTVTGLTLIDIVQGMSFTTLFCRNYYVNVPADLIKSAKIDGAGFLQIFRRI